jgi:hypothetical protein
MYSGDDGYPETAPVGSYPLGDTPTGLKDMAGNVWEWTASASCPYTDDGYDVGKFKKARVSRGGCWGNGGASQVRGAIRGWNAPSFRGHCVGFRCARADLFLLFTGSVSDLTSACAIAKGEGEQERHDGRSISTGRRNARKKVNERSEVRQKFFLGFHRFLTQGTALVRKYRKRHLAGKVRRRKAPLLLFLGVTRRLDRRNPPCRRGSEVLSTLRVVSARGRKPRSGGASSPLRRPVARVPRTVPPLSGAAS